MSTTERKQPLTGEVVENAIDEVLDPSRGVEAQFASKLIVVTELRRLRKLVERGDEVYICSECGRMWGQDDPVGFLMNHNRETGETRMTCHWCVDPEERKKWDLGDDIEHEHRLWLEDRCPCEGCQIATRSELIAHLKRTDGWNKDVHSQERWCHQSGSFVCFDRTDQYDNTDYLEWMVDVGEMNRKQILQDVRDHRGDEQ